MIDIMCHVMRYVGCDDGGHDVVYAIIDRYHSFLVSDLSDLL